MLLKYLNELEMAVQELAAHPDSDTLTRCTNCVATLDAYLDSQMEPVKQRGRELMDGLMPAELLERVGHSVH